MHLATRSLQIGAAVLVLSALTAVLYAGQEVSTPRAVPRFFTAVAPSTRWEGPQFLEADRKGNVFLVRGTTLDVFPVQGDQLGKPTRLNLDGPLSEPPSDIAVSLDGSQWAVLTSNQILWVKDAKQHSTPDIGWFATSVALSPGGPLTGVIPMSIGRRLTTQRPGVPPLMLKLDEGAWQTFVEGSIPKRAKSQNPINALFAEHTVRLSIDSKGRLWTAFPYTGRIVSFKPSGRMETEIVLGTGVPKYRGDEKALKARFEEDLLKQGHRAESSQMGVFTAKPAIYGLTAASQDGMLYMILESAGTQKGLVLARYNPVRVAVEAATLRVPSGDEVSMAAGRDGLYIAATAGNGGRWRISWEALDQAAWRDLRRATIRSGITAHTAALR